MIESIRSKGILNPLLIAPDGTIISGHRRLVAAKRVGLADVPVVVFGSADDLDILEALIESNRQRHKSNEQFGREATVMLELEGERANRRKAVRSPERLHVQNSAHVNETGQARQIVADKLGVSHPKVTQAAAVVKAIDEMEQAGDKRGAAQLRTTLNGKSVHAAYQKAKTDGHIPVAQTVKPEQHESVKTTYTLVEWDTTAWWHKQPRGRPRKL